MISPTASRTNGRRELIVTYHPGTNLGAILKGDANADHVHVLTHAKVTVVEFGDYQCPACKAEDPVVKQIIEEYKSNPNFNFVFLNFPLPQHANAQIAAEAAEAAGEQGKFWEMRSKLYETQADWSNLADPLDKFISYAKEFSLDTDKFKEAIQQKKFQSIIAADQQKGVEVGVSGTPTFYINGEKQADIPNLESFKKLIDTALAK